MNVSPVITREYKNESNWKLGENKPNTNPTCRGVASGEAGSNPIRVQDFAVRPCGLNALNKLYTIKILFFCSVLLAKSAFYFLDQNAAL